jgi:PAS domain S-box-containing protein
VKLTPRLTLAFLVYAIILLTGVGLLAYRSGRNSLGSGTISELQATALEKEAALNRWVEDKQTDITVLAAAPATLRDVAVLLMASPDSTEFEAARNELMANVQPRLDSGEFLEVSLIHPENGLVIVSTDPAEEGRSSLDQPYFLHGKNGPYVQDPYYSPTLQSITMTASAPLQAADGQLLGVLAAHLNLEDMNAIINRRTGLHETDDAYLVNTSGLFVTQPRFIREPVVLRRKVDTVAIEQCLQHKDGLVEGPDYRNVPAFVAYRWLPDRHLCLVIKIEETEAYRPARAFGGTIIVISAAALLFAAAMGATLARTLTRPILTLQSGAARFAQGDLNTRLIANSRDELGALAAEFNKMAEALTEQQTYLRRKAEQFFNLTLDLLCTVDSNGRLSDLNPAWESILGYKREDLKGQVLTDFVHPDDQSAAISALRAVTAESDARYEGRFRHHDGDYRWLAWALVSSPQDGLLYAASRDVTQRRLAEDKMLQQTEELERSNQELEQFAYVASHDLQEPLRLVSIYVQLLARRYQGKLDKDADEFIGFAVEGANRMKSLITDLLAYSRAGTRGKEFMPVAMEEAFGRVINNLQLSIQEHSAVITHDPLPEVFADQGQMIQLLQNLIGNAIKFHGPQSPRVHIGVRPLGQQWVFFVRDNGIGIDPQHTERIFIIFQRLHTREEYPGTGIGLAICRKIVERHGGQIWVDSEPGKGSTFYFTIPPLQELPPKAMAPERAKPRDAVADRATDLV